MQLGGHGGFHRSAGTSVRRGMGLDYEYARITVPRSYVLPPDGRLFGDLLCDCSGTALFMCFWSLGCPLFT